MPTFKMFNDQAFSHPPLVSADVQTLEACENRAEDLSRGDFSVETVETAPGGDCSKGTSSSGSPEDVATSVARWVKNAMSDAHHQHAHMLGTGPVRELEDKLRSHYGHDYALCVPSATMGLYLVFKALDLGGQTFVTTPYTWGGTVAGPLALGAQPVFADIEAFTLGIDPEAVAERVEQHPEARALLAVDIFGVPSDMQNLRSVADNHGLWYIADAAQSFGATSLGRPASAAADVLVTSFSAGKTLAAGEGGAVLTNHRGIYERLLWISQHPLRQKRELGLRLTNECALNGRIHPVSAVIANERFEHALSRVAQRQTAAEALLEDLNDTGVSTLSDFAAKGLRPSYFRVPARLPDHLSVETVERNLKARGWTASVEAEPVQLLHHQPEVLDAAATTEEAGQTQAYAPEADHLSVARQQARQCVSIRMM